MDMALALIANLSGDDKAQQVATFTEYRWHSDDDPFFHHYDVGDVASAATTSLTTATKPR